jgi:5-oxoprolinase (ATP-hydrolysing) subunit A
VDLNADVGEGFGVYTPGDDAALLPFVTSVSVACGFHAGDSLHMERAVKLAADAGVAVGAHPGYPDRRGFGRRPMQLSPEEIEADVLYQIGALAGFVRSHGLTLAHVKAHGALYHRAASEEGAAQAVARACARGGVPILVGPVGAEILRRAAAAHGLRYAAEGFADRRYDAAGALLPRTDARALLCDPEDAALQAVRLAREGAAETLCLHGDTPGAVSVARAVRASLEKARVSLAPLER